LDRRPWIRRGVEEKVPPGKKGPFGPQLAQNPDRLRGGSRRTAGWRKIVQLGPKLVATERAAGAIDALLLAQQLQKPPALPASAAAFMASFGRCGSSVASASIEDVAV
jgi:hypothetical protein